MAGVGLRALLFLAAVVLFVIAFLSDENYSDLLALGLACLAAGFAVGELGWDRRLGTSMRRDTT